MKSYLVRSLAIASLCFCALPSFAADAKTQARCAEYAKRAVEQFNILTRHGCQKDNDLRWQASYENHYNGCLKLPAFMSKSEEKIRDFQLHACGALNPDGSEASAQASTPQGVTPPSTDSTITPPSDAQGITPPSDAQGMALPQGPPPGAGVPAPPQSTDNDPCHHKDPPYGASALAHAEPGYGWKVGNGVLTYLDITTHQMRTYPVLRPAYFLNFIKCAHAALPPAGAYVSRGNGASGMLFLLNDQGSVLAYAISGDVLAKLLDGAQPSTDSAAGPGSADPGKAVPQIGGAITPPTGNNGVPCSSAQGPSFALRGGTFGTGGKISGSTLTYHDLNAPTKTHTYSVRRPGYYIAATNCMKQISNSGPWVSRNPGMFFILYDNGNVTASPVDAATMPKLLEMPH